MDMQESTNPPNATQLTLQQALQLAWQHYEGGRIEQAAGLCQQVLQSMPRQADALHLLGLAAHRLGKSAAAINLILQAIAVQASAPYYHSLGIVLQELGRFQEAATSYRSALALQPEFPHASYHLGMVLNALGQADAAIACYRSALHGNPQFAAAHSNLGNVLKGLGRLEQAVACYREALRLQPDLAEAHNNLGIALQAQGNFAQAEACYREALRHKPGFPGAHVQLATMLQMLGRKDEALTCYETALALQPDNESVQHHVNALRRISTEKAPPGYVRQLFDDMAGNFDAYLVGNLGYHIPEILSQALIAELQPNPHSLDVLDLGCGTGLFGMTFQTFSRRLTGVDLSEKMLDQARAKGIYAVLAATSLDDYMRDAQDASADLVVATDVFVYVGELHALFQQVRRVLRPDGAFAFSVESSTENDADYLLQQNGRYVHTLAYVRRLAEHCGLREASCAPVVIRLEAGQAVHGHLCILRNSSGESLKVSGK